MSLSPFMAAINQIADEKGLDVATIVEAVEQAIAAAYRKDYGKPKQIIRVKMEANSGDFKVWQVFQVVEEVENPEAQLDMVAAKKFDKKAKIYDEITLPLPYHADFGRIAAQTAKQVVIQKLREAERSMIYNEFRDKEGEILPASIQQMEGTAIIVNLGKTNGLMLPSDQIRFEHYYIGQRLRVYVKGVEETPRGPKIYVSRSDPKLIEGLFTLEVPEIQNGDVLLKGVAREAGERSKVAVIAATDTIDPVGSCVGQRGTRIQAILAELGDEKIDIILWDENPAQLISNALSPARIDLVELDENTKKATVYTPEDQLSLAIGKNGQNVRLAGKLTGYEIDIARDDKNNHKNKTNKDSLKTKKQEKKSIPKASKKKPVKTTKKEKSEQ